MYNENGLSLNLINSYIKSFLNKNILILWLFPLLFENLNIVSFTYFGPQSEKFQLEITALVGKLYPHI